MKFPHFRHELLQQNHWHPGDDLGRIKIIISEGFPRDLIAAPVERVKNVVVFSFQHAPLGKRVRILRISPPGAPANSLLAEMLENNGIAWPNPSMWRRQALNPTLPVPTYHPDNGAESHTHSPGRRSLLVRNIPNQCFPGATVDSNLFQSQAGAGAIGPLGTQSWQMPYLGRSNTGSGNALSHADSFSESAYREWVSSMTSGHPTGMDIWDGRASWQMNPRNSAKHPSDAIMSDYISPQTSDPMQISGGSLEDDPMSLKVPTNTPTGEARDDPQNPQFQQTAALNCDFASSLTQSLLNQPFPLPMPQHQLSFPSSELYYRKENRHASLAHANAALLQPASLSGSTETRKLSQSVFGIGGLETSTPVPTDGSEEMTSITLQHMFATSSRNPLADFGSSMMNSTGSTVGTPMGVTGVVDQADSTPVSNVKSLAAPTSGGGSSTSGNTAVKRTRNFTPASAKAIDEEDEPRRLSPHVRIAGFCGVDISSDSVH